MDTHMNIQDSPSPKMAAILSVYPYVIITEILTKYYSGVTIKEDGADAACDT